MSRRQQYLDTYARAAASIERQKQIRADIAEEQQQVRYLDSLLAQERGTLAAIEANFKTAPPESLDQAVSLLKEQYASEDARRRRAAGEGVARERALGLTPEEQVGFTKTDRNRPDAILVRAEKLIADPNTSPEKATAAYAFVIDQVGKDAPGIANLASVLGQKGVAPETRKAAPAVRAVTAADAARQQATDEAFRTAFFAGPSGIVGGYEGMAIADARKSTVAPENTSFNTAEDAFNAAISAMGDGALSADEFSSAEDFNYAKSIYAQAQAKKAYRNDERIHFEPSVLEARLRLRELQQRRESSAGAAYKDSAREAQRRELMARGVTLYDEDSKDAWRNQYAQYQGTPYYDVYIQAHEAVDRWQEEGGTKNLSPVTKAQRNAVQFANMLDAAKRPYSPATIMDELTKVGYSDSEAAEATSFLMAYKEVGGPKQGKSTYDALKAAEAKATAEAERRKAFADEAEADYQNALQRIKIEEQKVAAGPGGSDLYKRLIDSGVAPDTARSAVARQDAMKLAGRESAPQDLATDYARLVASGLTPEQARERMKNAIDVTRVGKISTETARSLITPPPPAPGSDVPAPAPATPAEPAATPAPVGFKDPTDPNSPTYFRADFGFKYTDKAGKEVNVPLTTKAGIALAMAEKGDVDAIKRMQAREAAQRKAAADKAAAAAAPAGAARRVINLDEPDPTVDTTSDFIRGPDGKMMRNPNKK